MGNSLSCFELHHEDWDKAHQDIVQAYPAAQRGAPTQRLDLPLSCYFISSGHNSYLTGNQLSSASGTSTIKMCLEQGCRVIELDVYNAQIGFDGPVCKHGGTLTMPVLFKDCIKTIGACAFLASPYPVIITIENHADADNQKEMAAILREELGGALFIPSADDMVKPWKSPQDLINKIVVRTNLGKCSPELKELVYVANSKFKGVRATLEAGAPTSSSFDEQKARKLVKAAFLASGVPWRPSISGKPQDQEAPGAVRTSSSAGRKARSKWQKAIPEHKQDVGDVAAKLIEQPADDASEETVVAEHTLSEMYAYSSGHLMRVYPGGLRVDSSNFDPNYAWSAGASLAALNWQKYDEPVWINLAMFAQNGGCGYVLKPEWMLGSVLSGQPSTGPNPLPPRPKPRLLNITVYSAYCRQYNNFSIWKDDPYVQMDVYGMPMDNGSQHTHTVNNSGRLVVDKTFTFPVSYPEVAVLLIRLKDEDFQPGKGMDDTLGHWAVALADLQEGDYHIMLTDLQGKQRQDRWVRLRLAWEDMMPPTSSDGRATATSAATATAAPAAAATAPTTPVPAAAAPAAAVTAPAAAPVATAGAGRAADTLDASAVVVTTASGHPAPVKPVAVN